jgi:putative membrane protein insertion efficiency factor
MKIVAVLQLPARALVALLRLYQRAVSPLLPVVFGPGCGCRFAPSCSHYAIDAVREHGALTGTFLALIRLIKCTPLHSGGFDPVPPRGKFLCTLVSHSPSAKADPRIA